MHTTEDIASQILNALAAERRRVVARWRIELIYRRIAFEQNLSPPDTRQITRVMNLLWRRRLLVPFPDEELKSVYSVDAPYARLLPLSEEQAIQEAHPWAVFSHLTAMVLHGLTDALPHELYVTTYGTSRERLPLGTRREEWVDVRLPKPLLPDSVGQVVVHWTRSSKRYEFGVGVLHDQPVPLYVSEVERTLCDALKTPGKCGGVDHALGAWARARELIRVEKLIDCAERFGSALMKQRVGYLLEEMGFGHERLDEWQANAQRGGSMKLVAESPYAPTYSERWNISLNVPEELLEELRSS